MVDTIKFSQFFAGGDLSPSEIIVGLGSNTPANTQYTTFPLLPPGTTASRPAPAASMYYRLRFNTDLESYEFYNPVSVAWVQIADTADVIGNIGTSNQVLANGTSGILVGGAVTLSTPQDIGPTSAVQFASVQFNTNNGLLDSFGNIILGLHPHTSPTSWMRVFNSNLDTPAFESDGIDADIAAGLQSKGQGQIRFSSANTSIPILFSTGTSYQHLTNFAFADTAGTQTATFQDSSGTLAWLSNIPGTSGNTVVIAGTTQLAVVNTTYIVGNAGQTTITLPVNFAPGDTIQVLGLGAGGWIVAANTGETIKFGQQTTSSGGTLTSGGNFDTLMVTGLVSNTTWTVNYSSSQGLTFA